MTPSQLEKWAAIRDEHKKVAENSGEFRLCAICYCAIPKADHAEHMTKVHRYELIELVSED
jgi:hypothetical protein